MKYYILLFTIFLLNTSNAQTDTVVLNTPKVFSISYYDSTKSAVTFTSYSSFQEIYIDTLTKKFLTIERKFTDLSNPLVSRKIERVPLQNIKSLGYISGTNANKGLLIGIGTGAIAGLILGSIAQSQDELFDSNVRKSVGISTIIGIVSGASLGYLLGGMFNDYTEYDLERYNNNPEKCYTEILKIARDGVKNFKRD
ncbi:MAG: hypothetical protein JST55_05960 [Bacteroidetes bacterium]|nr:hypothetical protein [Bacteroidota bacterium]